MAENLPDVLRANEAKAGLEKLLSKSRGRIPPAEASPVYTTTPDGRVLDRAGKVVFTPSPVRENKP